MAASAAISPGWLAPISMTAIPVLSVMRSRVRGTPIWLLRFPMVAVTRYFAESTAQISSLVVVLPLVPVRPRTGMRNRERCMRASLCKASMVSSTTMYCPSSGMPLSLETTAHDAPEARACDAKRLPSKFSPFRAKNMAPCSMLRLSVDTPEEERNASYRRLSIVLSIVLDIILSASCGTEAAFSPGAFFQHLDLIPLDFLVAGHHHLGDALSGIEGEGLCGEID